MKAVVLAAGIGSRLTGYRSDLPKPLLKLSRKPILSHILACLSKVGVKKAAIITGFRAEKIVEFVGSGRDWGLETTYIHNPEFASTNNVHSLYLARDFARGSSFYIINGDTYFHCDVLGKLAKSKKRGVALALDTRKKLGKEEMKVQIRGGRVVRLSKELKRADGEYIGVARVDKGSSNIFFDAVRRTIAEKGASVFYEEAFQKLADEGCRLRYESIAGMPWIEVDTPQDLKAAIEMACEKTKAVAVDIDGTLTNENQVLTPEALRGLRELKQLGLTVILASGHNVCGMESLARYLGASGVIIAENGGVLRFAHENRTYVLGSRHKVQRALRALRKDIKNLRLGSSTRGGYKLAEVEFERNVSAEKLRQVLARRRVKGVEVVDTGFAIHLKDESVSKGRALNKAAKLLKIGADSIAAVGDSPNDISMFKISGHSIALQNAAKEVKDAASFVTRSAYGKGFLEAVAAIKKPSH